MLSHCLLFYATCGRLLNARTMFLSRVSAPNNCPGAPSLPILEITFDWQGWPIFLLAEASLHTQNIKANGRVSLLCQTPREANGQSVSPVIV